jgi:hypothetical protein
MATITIGSLASGAPAVGTDQMVIERAGTAYKLILTDVSTLISGPLQSQITTNATDISTLQTNRIHRDGSVAMTGALTLVAASPTTDNHAARKKYVDDLLALKLGNTGGTTHSGTISLNAAPSIGDHLTNKTYVDGKIDSKLISLPEVFDASVNTYPPTYGGGAIKAGNSWRISVAGTPSAGVTVDPGDLIIALINAASVAADFQILQANIDTATETTEGIIELATTAEAQALTDSTRAVTPAKAGDILNSSIFKRTVVGAASKVLVEAETGIVGVTYTSTGAVAITLPDASSLVNPSRTAYTIVDEGGLAGTNAITITPAAGTINGAANLVLNENYNSASLYNNGTNWFIK